MISLNEHKQTELAQLTPLIPTEQNAALWVKSDKENIRSIFWNAYKKIWRLENTKKTTTTSQPKSYSQENSHKNNELIAFDRNFVIYLSILFEVQSQYALPSNFGKK